MRSAILIAFIASAGLAAAETVHQKGTEAARSMRGAGRKYAELFGDGARKVYRLYENAFHDSSRYPHSSEHAIAVTNESQVGKSVRRERWNSATLDDKTWTSMVSFDPSTGAGRLLAKAEVHPKSVDDDGKIEGAILHHGADGRKTRFTVEGTRAKYTATLVGSPTTVQASRGERIVARFLFGGQVMRLPERLRRALLDGKAISLVTIRTRTAEQPQRSLPPDVRPPTKITRDVKQGYLLEGDDEVSMLDDRAAELVRVVTAPRP